MHKKDYDYSMSIENSSSQHEDKRKPSVNAEKSLVFPEKAIENAGCGEYGFVVLAAHRARELSVGSPVTLQMSQNISLPLTAIMEMADMTISSSKLEADYLSTAQENTVSQEYYSASYNTASEEDNYENYMLEANQTNDGELDLNKLRALFDNPYD